MLLLGNANPTHFAILALCPTSIQRPQTSDALSGRVAFKRLPRAKAPGLICLTAARRPSYSAFTSLGVIPNPLFLSCMMPPAGEADHVDRFRKTYSSLRGQWSNRCTGAIIQKRR